MPENTISLLLSNFLFIFHINFSGSINCEKRETKNSPTVASQIVEFFDNFMLADDLFAKALRSFETYQLIIIYVDN